MQTDPIDDARPSTAPRLAIAPYYKDKTTGALYVHVDLQQRQEPWEEEKHLGPINVSEGFGDVESFVAYVQRHTEAHGPTFLTWNAEGLHAVLDYHDAGLPGRHQWIACYPFETSPEWRAWTILAQGQPVPHKRAIETLEDLATDIVEPAQADLLALLRSLRASVNATATTDLRPDGTTSVSFQQDKAVRAAGVELPPEFTIGIRVLKGHTTPDGRPVLYKLPVRVRASVGDDAKLALRFAMPTTERVLEDVYLDRVTAARALLGEGYPLLRAAD